MFTWQVQIGASMGNLADRRCQPIEPDDLLEIIPNLARLIERKEVSMHVADNVGYYGPYEATMRHHRSSSYKCWVGCPAGCLHMGIEADGGVKGCLSLQATRATEGNLQQRALRDIWCDPSSFSYNRGFEPSMLAGFCRTCQYAEVCRGGCFSLRTCEGGVDNPFCYHRVATLAQQRNRPSRQRYVPMLIAPAAILAAVGCGGSTNDEVAVYGVPAGGSGGAAGTGGHDGGVGGQSTGGNAGNGGSIPTADGGDATDEQVFVDAYGIPPDTGPDTPPVDAPDDPPIGDAYGLPADAQEDVEVPDATMVYGLPSQ